MMDADPKKPSLMDVKRQLEAAGVPVEITGLAYTREFEVVGEPGWIQAVRFHVAAEEPIPPVEEWYSRTEEKVLLFLLDCGREVRLQPEIVAGLPGKKPPGRCTVGDAIRSLEKRGLIYRPLGPRKGYALTAEGQRAAFHAAKHPEPLGDGKTSK